MSKKNKPIQVRRSNPEMPDPEVVVKKKQDVLSKARSKLLGLSDALKSNKNIENSDHHKKTISKSMTQVTLDYFFKHCPNSKEKNHIYANTQLPINKRSTLQKQNSVGSYPIKIEVTEDEDEFSTSAINRNRPATVCVDKLDAPRDAEALALERPRKKLSFREPEVIGFKKGARIKVNGVGGRLGGSNGFPGIEVSPPKSPIMKRGNSPSSTVQRQPSFDDFDLESQAMRVVRTVGQAFEVCHKLSINAPENDPLDQDEQDTLTQDLLSDRLSDITSDKPKRDLMSEGASDKMSLPPDDCSLRDSYSENNKNTRLPLPQLDILPPPPTTNHRKSPLTSAETYASPHSDALTSASCGSGNTSLPPPGGALSAHHELQLMREQLEQQSQQTQAAMAQLQLAREQLAAEQSARLEAQARTHQLLVHNRELLDHIAALVAHLQGGDSTGQQQTPPHMTMPQHQHPGWCVNNLSDHNETAAVEPTPVSQALGLGPQGLIENRAVTSCLPSSPLRTTFNPGGGVFNFTYPQPVETASFEAQLLQRLQNLSGYSPPSPYPYYSQTMPFLSPGLYSQPLLNNNYTLQPPPQKKPQPTPPIYQRHSYMGTETRMRESPARNSEPRQLPQQYPAQHQTPTSNQSPQRLHVQQDARQQRGSSPQPQNSSSQNDRRDSLFIKPLAQMGTLTTTDNEGRVRVIVPVPSNSGEDTSSLLANLRIADDLRPLNGPPITRTASEKVPNRSELMSQVQRTAWARHTTK